MPNYAILRFEKHKGNPVAPLEAHHERTKEKYASNPDIDTDRNKYNFHIIKPRSGTTNLSSTALKKPDARQGRTAQDLWIRWLPQARRYLREWIKKRLLISSVMQVNFWWSR